MRALAFPLAPEGGEGGVKGMATSNSSTIPAAAPPHLYPLPLWGRGGAPLEFLNVMAFSRTMKRVSDSEFRNDLANILDRVTEDREPVIITRDRGKPAAVLMSLEEFSSWEETLHLLRSPANAARLAQSIAEFESHKVENCEI